MIPWCCFCNCTVTPTSRTQPVIILLFGLRITHLRLKTLLLRAMCLVKKFRVVLWMFWSEYKHQPTSDYEWSANLCQIPVIICCGLYFVFKDFNHLKRSNKFILSSTSEVKWFQVLHMLLYLLEYCEVWGYGLFSNNVKVRQVWVCKWNICIFGLPLLDYSALVDFIVPWVRMFTTLT